MAEPKKYGLDPSLRKKKISLYTAAEVIAIIFLCTVGNVWDFVQMRFAFERIVTASYWEGVLQQAMLYATALILGYLYKLERLVIDDEEYARGMDQYHDRLKLKTERFPQWTDSDLNPMIKKEYYRDYITSKLYRFERHSKDCWKNEYNDFLSSKKSLDEYEWKYGKRSRKYSENRLTLERLILPDEIDKNSANFEKYPRVNPHSFTWGVHDNDVKSGEWKTENTVSKDVGMIWARKVVSVFLMAIIFGSIYADPDITELAGEAYGWAKIIIKYLMRCAAMVWCMGQGLFMGRKIFDADYILVISNRTRILDMFISWDVKNGGHDDPSYRILQYLQSQQDARDAKGGSGDGTPEA